MEQFETICQVLNEYLSDVILPNTAELLGIYGRVRTYSKIITVYIVVHPLFEIL